MYKQLSQHELAELAKQEMPLCRRWFRFCQWTAWVRTERVQERMCVHCHFVDQRSLF